MMLPIPLLAALHVVWLISTLTVTLGCELVGA